MQRHRLVYVFTGAGLIEEQLADLERILSKYGAEIEKVDGKPNIQSSSYIFVLVDPNRDNLQVEACANRRGFWQECLSTTIVEAK